MISMYRIGSATLLAGSVHFLPEGIELPDKLNKAYESKSALVMEASIEECDSSLQNLEEGTLKDFIPEGCFRRVSAAFENLGLDLEEAETLKPWSCAFRIQAATLEKAGFSYQRGVDEQLRSRAAIDGKPVHALEHADTVFNILDAIPVEQQQRMLNRFLDEADKIPEMMARMV